MTVIEVFADVGCPFTHIGLRRFVERRAELGRDDVKLHVRAWPLEIVNGEPMDPEFIAEEVQQIQSTMDTDLFGKFTAAAFPATSLPALALASAANRVDGSVGEAVSLELRDLLFEQGVNIADHEVLAAVAARHGIAAFDPTDTSSVMAEHALGVERGVIGSPHFFTPAGSFFCPALDVSKDAEGHLMVAANPEKFDEFMDACLA